MGELQVAHVVVDGSAGGNHSVHQVLGDHDPARDTGVLLLKASVSAEERDGLCQRRAPVVGTVRVCHRGVRIIANQPEETLVGEEADLLPFGTRHIATARVEVAQQQDVL